MRRNVILILTLLLISDDVFGKNGKTTKQTKPFYKTKNSDSKYKLNARVKRSVDAEKILLSNKDNINDDLNHYNYLDGKEKSLKLKSADDQDSPFWGNRGRRESASDETVPDVQLPNPKYKQNKNFYKVILSLDPKFKDEVSPFWSNRGRRNSDESKDDDLPDDFFWANRGRRQDDDPFWGTRGRRQEDESPFWGNRGRRENLVLPFTNSKDRFNDEEPFWGNRGRRQEDEPFWGNRGRRDPFETLIHAKNKLKSLYLYKDVINNKNELKDSIVDAISDLRNNNNNFERNRREDLHTPFWINRGRDSKMKSLFNGVARNRMEYNPSIANKYLENEMHSKTFQQNTVHDDRIYAEEPHYILVERSSRSSAEDDPFFITRGKKYSNAINKAIRGRRGALEEIVKSVRNDPYYIARGKKDYIKVGNSNATQSQFLKTRDLICATVELMMMKSEGNKVKRQAVDSDRDRRTILKKLALQLQMDPYFVSRGKRDGENNIDTDTLEQFINKVIVLCN